MIPEDFYMRSKYEGTVWQIIILAELGADGEDERIRRACEFILENPQDRESSGFSYLRTKTGGGTHSGVTPCLTGSMVWGLIEFGYLKDPRAQKGIAWITKYQRFDDGAEETPEGWPYKFEKCWGRHTCHMAVAKALKALAEIPPDERSKEARATIEEEAEHMLKHHIYKRSRDLNKVAKAVGSNSAFQPCGRQTP